MLHLHDQDRRLLDIAVLYRSHWNSLEIQLELRRRNIPFQIRGGLRFFEQAHMKDILCYLRIPQNPRDELAWQRALKMLPRVGARSRGGCGVCCGADPFNEVGIETASLLPSGAQPFFKSLRASSESREINSPAEMIDLANRRFYEDYMMSHYENAACAGGYQGHGRLRRAVQHVEAFLADA